MLDLKNFSCSMLVPRCLKQALSELHPFKATGNYMGGMQKMANFYLNECMCMTQLTFRSKRKTTVGDQIKTVRKTNKHRTLWSERKTDFLVHSQQRNTGALLSASELPGGSARPRDGNSSCDVSQKNKSLSTGNASLSNLPAFWLKISAERMHYTCNIRRISPGACHKITHIRPGTEFAKKLWVDEPLLFAFRWHHYVNSVVARPFRKIGKIWDTWNLYVLVTMTKCLPVLRQLWW